MLGWAWLTFPSVRLRGARPPPLSGHRDLGQATIPQRPGAALACAAEASGVTQGLDDIQRASPVSQSHWAHLRTW